MYRYYHIINSLIKESFSSFLLKKLETFRKERFRVQFNINEVKYCENIEKEINEKIDKNKIYFNLNDFSKYSNKIAKHIYLQEEILERHFIIRIQILMHLKMFWKNN